MSDYTVKFWRANNGARGVSIHHVELAGWGNVDAELVLIGREDVNRFIATVEAARDSAFELPPTTGEWLEEEAET